MVILSFDFVNIIFFCSLSFTSKFHKGRDSFHVYCCIYSTQNHSQYIVYLHKHLLNGWVDNEVYLCPLYVCLFSMHAWNSYLFIFVLWKCFLQVCDLKMECFGDLTNVSKNNGSRFLNHEATADAPWVKELTAHWWLLTRCGIQYAFLCIIFIAKIVGKPPSSELIFLFLSPRLHPSHSPALA